MLIGNRFESSVMELQNKLSYFIYQAELFWWPNSGDIFGFWWLIMMSQNKNYQKIVTKTPINFPSRHRLPKIQLFLIFEMNWIFLENHTWLLENPYSKRNTAPTLNSINFLWYQFGLQFRINFIPWDLVSNQFHNGISIPQFLEPF